MTEEYLKSKFHDTVDELLAVDNSVVKKSNDFYQIPVDNDKMDEELLTRFIDNNEHEMMELQEITDELMGRNLEATTNHMVLTTTGVDGQQQQFLVEQPNNVFHIGQSLDHHKSVGMTIFNPKLIKGKPTAEFLPGELRNTDYVKGDMASDIYQKTVKDPLGQRGLNKSVSKSLLKQMNSNTNGNLKKRGRPPKTTEESVKTDQVDTNATNINRIPSRPRIRRRNGEVKSLKDLNKTIGSPDSKLDYDPLHFIRCHAKDSAPCGQETRVWRCVFEPDVNTPGATTHCIATCGGECVCIIDCVAGKVKKRYKREHEVTQQEVD